MRDQLLMKPYRRECALINLDTHRGRGTHWVAYKKMNITAEYFDSFGNLQHPILNYLGNNVTYNYKREHFNTYNCGHLCLKFLCQLK